MLLRLITVISLIQFMLLMISGTQIDAALYRSLLVFMILFTVVYLTIFLLNIIRDNKNSGEMAVAETNNSKNKKEN